MPRQTIGPSVQQSDGPSAHRSFAIVIAVRDCDCDCSVLRGAAASQGRGSGWGGVRPHAVPGPGLAVLSCDCSVLRGAAASQGRGSGGWSPPPCCPRPRPRCIIIKYQSQIFYPKTRYNLKYDLHKFTTTSPMREAGVAAIGDRAADHLRECSLRWRWRLSSFCFSLAMK